MKRGFVIFILATLMIVTGIGCSQTTPKESNGKIELEFWTLQMLEFKDLINGMITDYEKTHPNVHVTWIDVPFSEGEKRTLTVMMSDHVPDVINLNPDFSAILASRNALLNMNDWLTPDQKQVYLPIAWQTTTLVNNDHRAPAFTFGLPWYITSSVTLYNAKLLSQAGYSTPPADYAQLAKAAKALKKQNVYALMPAIAESGNFLKELKKSGVRLYDDHGNAVFAQAGIPLLQQYCELYRDNLIPPEALTESHRAAVDRYQSGSLAMLLTGANFLNIVQENAPQIFKDTQVAPQFPQHSAYKDFSLMILIIPKKSAHPKEAVDFARFITNDINQLKLAQLAPVLPSTTAALKNPYFNQPHSSDSIARARSISAAQLLAATEAYQIRPGQHEINDAVDYDVQMAMLGKLSPAEALAKAQKAVNDALASNR